MRRIAIINQKGGCGKTTSAINLAGVFAAKSQRTLLVDMDPQSHCAAGLAIPEGRIDLDVGDAMLHAHPQRIDRARLLWRISRNLDLLPSRMKLAGIEASRGGLSEHADRHTRLSRLIDTLLTDYDACCIDCPPSIGLLTFNALTAATEILIPVETSYFSLQGAAKQVATIRSLSKRLGSRAEYWLVPTIHDEKSALAKDLLEELRRRFADRLAPVVIRYDSALKEAASFGQPVIEYNSSSRGSEDYIALAEWLISKSSQQTGAPAAVAPEMSTPSMLEGPISPEGFPVVTVSPPARAQQAMAAKLATPVSGRPSSGFAPSVRAIDSQSAAAHSATAVITHGRSAAAVGHATSLVAEVKVRPEYRNALSTACRLRKIEVVKPVETMAGALSETDETPSTQRYPHGVTVLGREVIFVQPAGVGNRIAIAGDFNGWSPQTHVMHRDDRRGVFEIRIPLSPGERHYRLVVDGRWTHDPFNSLSELSPFGEKISVVEIASVVEVIQSTPRLVAASGAD